MANIQSFVFFNDTSKELVSNSFGNPAQGESVTIQVISDGAVDLTVQAKSDLDTDNWHNIAAICLEDYSLNKKITKAGLYVVPFEGISKIRMESANPVGGFKVFAIATGG